MIPRLHWLALALSLITLRCGGAQTAAESPGSEGGDEKAENESEGSEEGAEGAEEESDSGDTAVTVPTECHKNRTGPCLPNPKFVKKLCNDRNPSMAIFLFGNPRWSRGYLTRKTEAWNASGGASTEGYLEFDEEVLLLFERKSDLGGMQVSGAGAGYDALRWDGSCVTLSGEEVTSHKPPSPRTPKLDWRFLDDNVQEALRKDSDVTEAYRTRRQECKGAVSGQVSLKCVKADQALTDAVIRYVRTGPSIPVPTSLPE